MKKEITDTQGTFDGLGLHQKLVEILRNHKYTSPTPIQKLSIPVILTGKDVIGLAQTGTGKTLAFGLPAIQRIVKDKTQALVLAPTRELVLQIDEQLQKIGNSLGLKTSVVIGGASMGNQIRSLKQNPHIIVATPGRLNDLINQKIASLSHVGVFVLDEADRMLDMGFLPQLKTIMQCLPKNKQTLLFSATMPDEMKGLCEQYMKSPQTIAVTRPGETAIGITQGVYNVTKEQKFPLLSYLIDQEKGSVLVFTKTKFGAKKVTTLLNRSGKKAVEIHSNKSLNQRQAALASFKKGSHQIMVATDIAARGIHVSDIMLVVNYDVPAHAEDYVHRIGRTARAGKKGHAVSFATIEDKRDIRDIEKLIKQSLPVLPLPATLPTVAMKDKYVDTNHERPEFDRRHTRNTPSRGTRVQGKDSSRTSTRDGQKPERKFQPKAGKPTTKQRPDFSEDKHRSKKSPSRRNEEPNYKTHFISKRYSVDPEFTSSSYLK